MNAPLEACLHCCHYAEELAKAGFAPLAYQCLEAVETDGVARHDDRARHARDYFNIPTVEEAAKAFKDVEAIPLSGVEHDAIVNAMVEPSPINKMELSGCKGFVECWNNGTRCYTAISSRTLYPVAKNTSASKQVWGHRLAVNFLKCWPTNYQLPAPSL